MFLYLLLIALYCSIVSADDFVSLNIHIKLAPELEQQAIQYNAAFNASLAHEGVHLATLHQPHITLYLASFPSKNIPGVLANLTRLITNSTFHAPSCNINLGPATLNGTYSFWSVYGSECLQRFCDQVVYAVADYSDKNSTIPSWIYDLPVEERNKRINYIRNFGSPNVFDLFAPHITIMADVIDSAANITNAFNLVKDKVNPASYKLFNLSIGISGDFGTVLRGQDLLFFEINNNDDDSDSWISSPKHVGAVILVVGAVLIALGAAVYCTYCSGPKKENSSPKHADDQYHQLPKFNADNSLQ